MCVWLAVWACLIAALVFAMDFGCLRWVGWVDYIFAGCDCLVGCLVWICWLVALVFVLGFMLIGLLFVGYMFAYSLPLFDVFGSFGVWL